MEMDSGSSARKANSFILYRMNISIFHLVCETMTNILKTQSEVRVYELTSKLQEQTFLTDFGKEGVTTQLQGIILYALSCVESVQWYRAIVEGEKRIRKSNANSQRK